MRNTSMTELKPIPSYLKQFIVEQHYDEYTHQDHAVWRYIMRRNVAFLKDYAHEAYLEGLKKTGITLDRIPNIDEMNQCLAKIGWRAVVVDGFVPPAAFMEFQALKILVISAEIRNINNILYTPAPDIIHEAAGHAPIIANPEYSAYLQKFGEYGMKAVFSKEDYEIYEAIRYLSIIKEFTGTTQAEIDFAEKDLEEKMNAVIHASESNLLSRMHWWTVEYGLVGTPNDFKLFGAGLLSSVGESKHCLNDEVKKIPLDKSCVHFQYDITTMQPQLFVAKDFTDSLQVLEDFADTMSFRKGGLTSMELVKETQQVGTLVYSSGLQVSGIISEIITDSNSNPIYFKTSGSTQLAIDDKELENHGINRYLNGLESPIGNLSNCNKNIEDFKAEDFLQYGIIQNKAVTLNFESGIMVSGNIELITKTQLGNILFLEMSPCVVTLGSTVLFEHSDSMYTLALGSKISSAFSGSADKENFNVYPPKSERNALKIHHSDEEKFLFKLYTMVREMREMKTIQWETVKFVFEKLNHSYPEDWLLRLELLELLSQYKIEDSLNIKLNNDLNELKKKSDTHLNVITAGLNLIYDTVSV
ncbi:MAG: aromatic amino acid hydroxylase [Bacteroidetes bacterium]|nr:aromatic amino acid hydroxylase [Bacteroidota bacterium]NCQ11693.1 aromatic amino acid hydroxylase [Bacteroidota bacterium]